MKTCSILACAAVLVSSNLFCEDLQEIAAGSECSVGQGEPLKGLCPAYNAPATVSVNPKDFKCRTRELGLFFDLALNYWYAGEEGLKIASTAAFNSGTTYYPQHISTLSQSFDYKLGFQVGAGIVGDSEWVMRAGYTWYRGTDHKSSGAPMTGNSLTAGTASALNGADVWAVDDWFLQGTATGQALVGPQVKSTWQLAMDIIDWTLGRPFYQGRWLTVSPFAGLRSALIRQSMKVFLTEETGLFDSLPSQPIESFTRSNSWSIGPRVGGTARCLFPMGFRVEGELGVSVLYTRYTSVKHWEDIAATNFNAGSFTASMNNYNCIRPSAEAGLGLGWGAYIFDRDYHIDFSADYDFMIFWSQNMIRKLMDDTLTGTSASAGDLYVHGLTVTGRFDF